jgi:peptidyl-dipeptidase A
MSLTMDGQDPAEIQKIFDDLDVATKDIYRDAKAEIDLALAKKYGIKVSELRPWHYQNRYFQEVPGIFAVNLDSLYKNKDVLALTKDYFAKMGLPIDQLVKNSDLYPKPGKYQHAVAFDIDRLADIRVIANISNDNYWMGTLLHEFGHALYFQKIDLNLPWELRLPAHTFTTEAVALFFQGMIYSPQWMREDLQMNSKDVEVISANALEYNRLNSLIFSRWTQVMYRFEKSMYENPDQDLNQLWWDLVQKYQLVQKPEGRNAPDWATKIHIIQTPIYYHNYMLGHLYAAQLRHYINTEVVTSSEKNPSYTGQKAVGEYLLEKVFAPGARYDWSEFIEKSTGEKLNPSYFGKEVMK